MKTESISPNGNNRAILIFLGWGMDATPFAKLNKPGYDVIAVSDYTGYETTPPEEAFKPLESTLLASSYAEIVVIAWSFGVRIASDFLRIYRPRLPLTRAIAVNGTGSHVDDHCGIPCSIFNGTLANLSEVSVRKFYRRMFASPESFDEFRHFIPKRHHTSLKAELETFAALKPLSTSMLWDRAIIGGKDAIFPVANQCEAWRNTPTDIYDSLPHFPDFQQIIDKYIIDKDLVAQRFAQAGDTYRKNATVQADVAHNLWHYTLPYLPGNRTALRVLEVGCGCGTLTDLYLPELQGCDIELWDIAPSDTGVQKTGTKFQLCDAETTIRSQNNEYFDLIISASTLQWFNSPEQFIIEATRTLRHNGIMAFALYGPGTYREIAMATGNTLQYPKSERLIHVAKSAGMDILKCHESSITHTFASLPDMLHNIKLTGVNAINRIASGSTGTNASAIRFLRHYPIHADGSVTLTYNPIYLILRKPAATKGSTNSK